MSEVKFFVKLFGFSLMSRAWTVKVLFSLKCVLLNDFPKPKKVTKFFKNSKKIILLLGTSGICSKLPKNEVLN